MKVELISIGDELLIGQTINTNAAWLGQEISKIGGSVTKVITISDDANAIVKALSEVDSDLCIVTGGLGPTNDDLTKHILAKYFDRKLTLHEPTLRHIEAFFKRRNRPMLQVNIDQAMLPEGCEILFNRMGTAAGMWFHENGKSLISLPGVPFEMKGIFSEEILPKIKERFSLNSLYHRTLLTHGIGESFLAEKIKDWEERLHEDQLSLAYLPSPGIVKLRITSHRGQIEKELINRYIKELIETIPNLVFGFEEETMGSVLGNLLKKHNRTIGSVESCTAGNIASALVNVAGSSKYFSGSLLTYQTEMKTRLLGISQEFIHTHDVVSEEVAIEMAVQGKDKLQVDYCIGTTGIMGPDAGDSLHSVGTVWVAIATPKKVYAQKFNFGDNRSRNIEMTTLASLNLVRLTLLQEFPEDHIKILN
jgi:nicotinamide-nucleotide amidase